MERILKPLDLNNLPFDPAQEAGRWSLRVEKRQMALKSKQSSQEPASENILRSIKSDPISEAMKRHPGLTREKALAMAEAFGF
jgi:hypothetical protein